MGGPRAAFDQPDAGMPRRFGKYTLLSRLATGGMADVYVALLRADFGFEKLVVIKCLLPNLTQDPRHVAMFLDEARTAATLTHPNIVQMFDAGEVDGTYYIAMEYIEGQDLRSTLRELAEQGHAGLPLVHAVFIMSKMLSGIEYAHQKRDFHGNPLRIVHRDISPQNVVITFSGDVKIVDFGVAKSALQLGEKTEVGQLKGKVAYMSPEQAKGQPIDWRSDLFSAGVVLFELTTGQRLFRGANEVETLRRIYGVDYTRPSDVVPDYPPELEAIVVRSLAKDRRVRYQSARDMQIDLEQFTQHAGLALSDVAFERWVESHLHHGRVEQEQVLTRVRKLAAGAVGGTPARTAIKTTLVGVPAPAHTHTHAPVPMQAHLHAHAPVAMQPAPLVPVVPRPIPSTPPPIAPLSSAPPPLSSAPPPSQAPPSENPRTLRASVSDIPPPGSDEDPFRRPRRRLRGPVLLASLVLALLLIMASTQGAATANSAVVRGVHARVNAWLLQPVRRSWNAMTGPAEPVLPPSRVEIRSSTPEATLELDGKPVLNAQVVEGLASGSRHRLYARAPGHEPRELWFTVEPGPQLVNLTLSPAPASP